MEVPGTLTLITNLNVPFEIKKPNKLSCKSGNLKLQLYKLACNPQLAVVKYKDDNPHLSNQCGYQKYANKVC